MSALLTLIHHAIRRRRKCRRIGRTLHVGKERRSEDSDPSRIASPASRSFVPPSFPCVFHTGTELTKIPGIPTGDRVIKLLRSELESRTGELSESRDTISLLSTERHVAYTRIDNLSTDLEEYRREAEREKKESREEHDKSTAEAREREQRLTRQVEETVEKWTGLLFEAKRGEEAVATELKDLRNEVEKKEEEINQYVSICSAYCRVREKRLMQLVCVPTSAWRLKLEGVRQE